MLTSTCSVYICLECTNFEILTLLYRMAYIEAEMRKRRGEPVKEEDEEDDKKTRKAGPLDIYEELYHLPERLRVIYPAQLPHP